MYIINFFNLAEVTPKKYIHPKCTLCNTFYEEKLLNFELQLTYLEDVKSFLNSDFYKQIKYHLDDEEYINQKKIFGIIITLHNRIIYKELFRNWFWGNECLAIHSNINNKTIYKIVNDEESIKDLVLIHNKGLLE